MQHNQPQSSVHVTWRNSSEKQEFGTKAEMKTKNKVKWRQRDKVPALVCMCNLFCTCSHTELTHLRMLLGSPRGGWSSGLRDSTWGSHRELQTKSGCHLSLFVLGMQPSALGCPERGESSQPKNPAQGGFLWPDTHSATRNSSRSVRDKEPHGSAVKESSPHCTGYNTCME